MTPAFHLLYSSVSNGFVSSREIDHILEVSRKNNELAQITGLLIYRSGHFLQLLEGPELEVIQRYQRIQKDRRHHEHKTLASFHSEGRLFPEWKMGVIRDEQSSAAIFSKLNQLLSTNVPSSDDMKGQIIEIFRTVSSSK